MDFTGYRKKCPFLALCPTRGLIVTLNLRLTKNFYIHPKVNLYPKGEVGIVKKDKGNCPLTLIKAICAIKPANLEHFVNIRFAAACHLPPCQEKLHAICGG
jgi:hypothetical protein